MGEAGRQLRLVIAIALATSLAWAVTSSLGLGGAAAYAVVIAALLIQPDFGRWPAGLPLVLAVTVLLALGMGTLLRPLLEAPLVWEFAIVTTLVQLLGQALPDRLMALRGVLPVVGILPLLAKNSTWLTTWHEGLAISIGIAIALLVQACLRLPEDSPPAGASPGTALPGRSLGERFSDGYFWRKLMVSTLALSVGMGLGAVNPKYVYFGVVILLNDSIGTTLLRVRDRMVGVSLGVLLPWLVFNSLGTGTVAIGIVMGGTSALMLALRLPAHLRTALISSGVTFAGYGPLADWYIPSRWIDYLMGCALALLACVLFAPASALQSFRRQAEARLAAAKLAGEPGDTDVPAPGLDGSLRKLLPSAMEEARWLGQQASLQTLLQRLEGGG
jgi:uncharacterized membrane protein YgaE (UPF0421/DUF939 family)